MPRQNPICGGTLHDDLNISKNPCYGDVLD